MDNGDIEGGPEDNFHAPIGRKYRPVVDNDSAVLEMSSMGPSGSSSSSSSALPVPQAPLKYVRNTLSLLPSIHIVVNGDVHKDL